MTIADVGEFGLIARITARLGRGPATLLGPGDDAAVVRAGDGRVVVTTDLLVEGQHFRRDWSSGYHVGRKAAAQNMADLAAMGAVPTALLVGLGAPPDLELAWVDALGDGLRDESAGQGAAVVGGDVVRATMVIVAVSALGDLQGRAPVPRSGARPGDIVAVCGRLGWAQAGVAALSAGLTEPAAAVAEVVAAHRVPRPPYAAGPQAARLAATAMCDVSDGLLADLGHLAEASEVRIDVARGGLEVAAAVRDVAGALGVDPYDWLLGGGEDHALLATFPPDASQRPPWREIGGVRAGTGVYLDGQACRPVGWDHFRGSAG